MICKKCSADRKPTDFLNKNGVCYRCVYNAKLEKYRDPEPKKCRICETPIASQRWVYCSNYCSDIGEQMQKKRHWTALVRSI